MARKFTQRDIAKAAGVDVSTVSLALNAHPRIPEATRERILSMARQMGYTLDPALASLASSRWQGRRDPKGLVLALICDNLQEAEEEFLLNQRGILAQAKTMGYGVEVYDLRQYDSPELAMKAIEKDGIRGMIVGQSRQDLPAELYKAGEVVRVQCGFLREAPIDRVMPDLRRAVVCAWENLEQRHAKIDMVLIAEPDLASDRAIVGAACGLQWAVGERLRVITTTPDSAEENLSAAGLQGDVVVTLNFKHAHHLRPHLHSDVSIVPLHRLPGDPPGPGVDLRLEEVGKVAVNLLELKMRRIPLASAEFQQVLSIEPKWVE